jgi:probable lipoprotein NlpC
LSKEVPTTSGKKEVPFSKKASTIVSAARKYNGTPYKQGGVDRHGMDCSGLVYVSYGKAGITMPRRSIDQGSIGELVKLDEVKAGDLLFFDTENEKPRKINHVGIVIKMGDKNNITFIHATVQMGVMENKMSEPYYKKSFIKAMRVL